MDSNRISSGSSAFLIKDDELKKGWYSNFIAFLEKEGFNSQGRKGHFPGINWIYVNLNSKIYAFGYVKPITQERMRVRKNLLASKSGVKPIRLHDFRHSCASLLINNGANIMIVAKYLGHTKIDETLNTYSHLFKNKMEDIVKIMNTLY